MKKSKQYIDGHKCRIRGYTVVTVAEAEKACMIEAAENASVALKAFCDACGEACGRLEDACEKLNHYKNLIDERIRSEKA